MKIRLKKKSTPRGVSLPRIDSVANSSIEPAPLPDTVTLQVPSGPGISNEVLVKKGDKVLTGQKIAASTEGISIPVHATVAGEVDSIASAINPSTGEVMKTILITSQGSDENIDFSPVTNMEELNVVEILHNINEAGIVSAGDDYLSVYMRLVDLLAKKVDALILNGFDSETNIFANHRLTLEYGEELLSGLNILKKILSPKIVYIALRYNSEEALHKLEKLISERGYDFKIVPVNIRYPVVEEKMLVKTVLDRQVPANGILADVGVAVFDVSVSKAIHDAVYLGRPYLDKVITVTGEVKNPKNVLVRFGTPVKNLLEICGGVTVDNYQIIMDGLVTGTAQYDHNSPIDKGNSGVLIQKAKPVQVMECINCGRCVQVCPMGLLPSYYPKYVKAGRYSECEKNYIRNCTECGICAYICPANIPIVEYIKIAKHELSKNSN